MAIKIPSNLSDDELDSGLKRLAAREREAAAQLDACVAELKARGLPIPEAVQRLLEDREPFEFEPPTE
jgi:hypothetical protein